MLGLDSIVKKISPVFSDCYVFVTMINETDVQVNVSQDSILGICQASHVEVSKLVILGQKREFGV